MANLSANITGNIGIKTGNFSLAVALFEVATGVSAANVMLGGSSSGVTFTVTGEGKDYHVNIMLPTDTDLTSFTVRLIGSVDVDGESCNIVANQKTVNYDTESTISAEFGDVEYTELEGNLLLKVPAVFASEEADHTEIVGLSKTDFGLHRLLGDDIFDFEYYLTGDGLSYVLNIIPPAEKSGAFSVDIVGHVLKADGITNEVVLNHAIILFYDTRTPDLVDFEINSAPADGSPFSVYLDFDIPTTGLLPQDSDKIIYEGIRNYGQPVLYYAEELDDENKLPPQDSRTTSNLPSNRDHPYDDNTVEARFFRIEFQGYNIEPGEILNIKIKEGAVKGPSGEPVDSLQQQSGIQQRSSRSVARQGAQRLTVTDVYWLGSNAQGPSNFFSIDFNVGTATPSINDMIFTGEVYIGGVLQSTLSNDDVISIFAVANGFSIRFNLPEYDYFSVRLQVEGGIVQPDSSSVLPHVAIDVTLTDGDGDPPVLGISTTITLGSNQAEPGDVVPITVVFGESVNGFTAPELTTDAGTITNFAGSGDTYTANLNLPLTGSGVATVSIASGVINGVLPNNAALASVTYAEIIHELIPTISIADAQIERGELTTATITFPSAHAGFEFDDLSIDFGILSNFNIVNSLTYTVDITAPLTSSGNITLTLAANALTGNTNPEVTATVSWSAAPFGDIVWIVPTSPVNPIFTAELRFDVPVSSPLVNDIRIRTGNQVAFQLTAQNTTIAPIAGTNNYLISINASADITGSALYFFRLRPDTISYEGSNYPDANFDSPEFTIDDTVGVVAMFTITTPTATAVSGVPIVFSIASNIVVNGLTNADITVVGGTAEPIQGSGSSYTVRVTPPSTGSGTITLTIDENAVDELNDETSHSINYSPPAVVTINFAGSSIDSNQTSTAVVSSNKTITGLTLSDFDLSVGTLVSLTPISGSSYNVVVRAPSTGSGSMVLTLAANSVDQHNNSASDSIQYVEVIAEAVMTVSITETSVVAGSVVVVNVSSNISVSGLALNDFATTRGTLSNFQSLGGNQYSLRLTLPSTGNGNARVTLAADSVNEGNNQASDVVSYTAPVIPDAVMTVSITETSAQGGAVVVVNVSSNISVTGLSIDDFTTTRGILDNFQSLGNNMYSLDLTLPDTGSGNARVRLLADSVLEGNNAATDVIAYTEPTLVIEQADHQVITVNTAYRLDLFLTGEPDTCVVDGDMTGFHYDVTPARDQVSIIGEPDMPETQDKSWQIRAEKNGDFAESTVTYEVVPSAPVISRIGRQTIYKGATLDLFIPVANIISTIVAKSPLIGVVSSAVEEGIMIGGNVPFGVDFTIDESLIFIMVTNSGGSDSWMMPIDVIDTLVPSAPRNVTAVGAAFQVNLAWEEPATDGGNTILNYVTRHKITDAVDEMGVPVEYPDWESTGTTNLFAGIAELDNDTDYTVQVAAQTSAGIGNASEEVTAMTDQLSIPGQPETLSATISGNRVSLRWNRPFETGDTSIVRYEYRLNGVSWIDAGSNTTETVTLTTTGTHSFEVRAVNSDGPGPAAGPVEIGYFVIPSAPLSLTADIYNGEVSLRWNQPINNGGTEIIRYEYRIGSGGWVSVGLNLFASVSLTSAGTRSFTVRAVNAVGNGPASNSVSVVLSVPSAPINISAEIYSGEVSLYWDEPINDGNSNIIGYEYRIGSGGWISVGNTTSAFITLTSAGTYSFRVRAINGVGNGNQSTSVSVSLSTPSAPTNLSASSRFDGGLYCVENYWGPPDNDGGFNIIEYRWRGSAGLGFGPWNITGSTSFTSCGYPQGITVVAQVQARTTIGWGATASVSISI